MLRITDNPFPRWPHDRPIAKDTGEWCVARVKPRNEKALARELARLDVGYYLPMVLKRSIRRDNGKPRKSVVCFFPGYISITGYRDRRDEILRSGRIINVIEVLDQEGFVIELESVRRAIEHKAVIGIQAGLVRGQKVIITSGPLRGVEGIVTNLDQADKVYLNVNLFNRAVLLKVSEDCLAPLESPPADKIDCAYSAYI